jgi:AraC-like DNA-binding protein
MGGVADLHHTAAAPLVGLQPFDRPAVDLLVLVQTGEIFLHQPAKLCEAVAQASEPASHRILQPRPGHVAKTMGAPVANRAEPKKATVAEPKLQARQASRTDRGNAAPCQLSAVNRDPRHAKRAVSSIAFEVGFGDLSYFNRSFRRCYGATPSEVRNAAAG